MDTQNLQNTPIQNLPVVDGTDIPVATDSQSVNAINLNPENQIAFEAGNFNEFQKLPDTLSAKISTVTNTIIPLVEAALIELLQKSSLYRRESFQVTPVFSGLNFSATISMKYHVDSWIATDVAIEDISQDANYVYSRINVVPNIRWSTCAIDTTEGSLTIEFDF